MTGLLQPAPSFPGDDPSHLGYSDAEGEGEGVEGFPTGAPSANVPHLLLIKAGTTIAGAEQLGPVDPSVGQVPLLRVPSQVPVVDAVLGTPDAGRVTYDHAVVGHRYASEQGFPMGAASLAVDPEVSVLLTRKARPENMIVSLDGREPLELGLLGHASIVQFEGS